MANTLALHLANLIGGTRLAYESEAEMLNLLEDPHITGLVQRGQLFDPGETNYLCDYPPGLCHQGVCNEYLESKEEGDQIFTGMALNRGVWFRHSWIVNKDGNIVEPCKEISEAYFGMALNEEERSSFIEYWHRRTPNWNDITEEEKSLIRDLVGK